MKPFPIPVVPYTAPGLFDEDESLQYLPSPGDMSVFRAPIPRETPPAEVQGAAKAILAELLDAMRETPFDAAHPVKRSLFDVPAAVRVELNELLGQGEVGMQVAASADVPALQIQESAFAGIWRIQSVRDDGTLASDEIEAGACPRQVTALLAAQPRKAMVRPALDEGLMNAPALLGELFEHSARHKGGNRAHVINLSLLPVTPQDLAWLDTALGRGPVVVLSRGYGNCRITSTALPHTWWVQYFNSMDQLILNTLEVVDLPEVALAAAEDYEDSIARLGEWLDCIEVA